MHWKNTSWVRLTSEDQLLFVSRIIIPKYTSMYNIILIVKILVTLMRYFNLEIPCIEKNAYSYLVCLSKNTKKMYNKIDLLINKTARPERSWLFHVCMKLWQFGSNLLYLSIALCNIPLCFVLSWCFMLTHQK